MVEDYSCSGTVFREDIDLPLPEDDQWDEKGKKDILISFFWYISIFVIFLILRYHILHCVHWSIMTTLSISY